MAPTLSWERWSLAVCLGDKTVFPAALLCRVGPGAGTGSRGGGQQQIPEHRVHNTEQHRDDTPHTHTHTTHCDSGRPAHATHARSWRDRSSRTRSPRGRTNESGSAPEVLALPRGQQQRHCLGFSTQSEVLTYLLTYLQSTIALPSAFASARRPGRRSERGASTRHGADELGDQTSEACPPQDESPPAKVG